MKDIIFLEPTVHEDVLHSHEIPLDDINMDLEKFFEEYGDQPITNIQDELNKDLDAMQENIVEHNKKVQNDIDKAQEELNEEMDDIISDLGKDTTLNDLIPGSDTRMDEFVEEEVEEAPKTYENDRHLPDFMNYITKNYPAGIPKHDGRSMLGCEKAISWLQRLSNDISTNVRNDVDGVLDDDMSTLSEIQESILTDILVLKDHMKKLKQMLPEKTKKADQEAAEIIKSASTPNNMVICISPFIRAITGILINSTVSAGKPFEDVYDYLLEKYQLTEREQLEVLQVLKDMGQPIFKDRGTMPAMNEADSKMLSEKEESLKGFDFITNYFA